MVERVVSDVVDTTAVVGQPYRPRLLDGPLDHALTSAGAVVIEGARATGKTMTALHAAASYVFLDDPETQLIMEVAPRTVLEGDAPRLLDEWQLSPELWNLVRRAVDASSQQGRFILTGSAVPADDVPHRDCGPTSTTSAAPTSNGSPMSATART